MGIPKRATASLGESPESLHRRLSGRYNKGVDWFILGSSAWTSARGVYNYARAKVTFTVAVTSDDRIYSDVHTWLLSTITNHEVKAMVAASDWGGYREAYEFDGPLSKREPKISLFSDDRSQHRVVIGGHKVTVLLDKPELRDAKDAVVMKKMERIVFTTTSVAGRDAVVDLLADILAKKQAERKVPKFNVLGSWGDWVERSDVPRRDYSSVILRAGLAEELRDDLQTFLDSEEEYVKRSMPYHRCYLLYGPPGSGKTSVAKALATEFSLDCWFMGLGDVNKDTGLLSLISQVKTGSMLLLEDIDVFHAASSREESGSGDSLADLLPGVSLSGLLNGLDGMATPHGLITVITTNHIEKLDPALLRTGRVDKQIFIDYADDDQANRLFKFFYGHEPSWPLSVPDKTAPSDLMEIFKRNMDHPATAEREVAALSVTT